MRDAHSSGEAPVGSVFFTQHIPEIVRIALWAGQFFVACGNPLAKVSMRRRGGNPKSIRLVFSGSGKTRRVLGTKGAFRGCNSPGHRRNPPTGQQLEVRDEDGEKPPPQLRGRVGCGFGWAGSRSSRQGQTSRIRESL